MLQTTQNQNRALASQHMAARTKQSILPHSVAHSLLHSHDELATVAICRMLSKAAVVRGQQQSSMLGTSHSGRMPSRKHCTSVPLGRSFGFTMYEYCKEHHNTTVRPVSVQGEPTFCQKSSTVCTSAITLMFCSRRAELNLQLNRAGAPRRSCSSTSCARSRIGTRKQACDA